MRSVAVFFATIGICLCFAGAASNADEAFDLGFRTDTQINPSPDGEICPGTDFLQNDDGTFENGYMWSFGGVQEPYYGAWAECYVADFVCGIQFAFTQIGNAPGHVMDVYVWEDDGVPPPDNNPGNVLCVLRDIDPNPIDFWPDISLHNIQVCCQTDGAHFVGYWVNAPLGPDTWFIAADENGPGLGCPRTNIAPDIGYPTGWSHPSIVSVFGDCKDLGIREFSGIGDCPPTPTSETTWGAIKALY